MVNLVTLGRHRKVLDGKSYRRSLPSQPECPRGVTTRRNMLAFAQRCRAQQDARLMHDDGQLSYARSDFGRRTLGGSAP